MVLFQGDRLPAGAQLFLEPADKRHGRAVHPMVELHEIPGDRFHQVSTLGGASEGISPDLVSRLLVFGGTGVFLESSAVGEAAWMPVFHEHLQPVAHRKVPAKEAMARTGAEYHEYRFQKTAVSPLAGQIKHLGLVTRLRVLPDELRTVPSQLPLPPSGRTVVLSSGSGSSWTIATAPGAWESAGGTTLHFWPYGYEDYSGIPMHRTGCLPLGEDMVISWNQGSGGERFLYRSFRESFGMDLAEFAVLVAVHVARRLGARHVLGTANVRSDWAKPVHAYGLVFRSAGMKWLGYNTHGLALPQEGPIGLRAALVRKLPGMVDLEIIARQLTAR